MRGGGHGQDRLVRCAVTRAEGGERAPAGAIGPCGRDWRCAAEQTLRAGPCRSRLTSRSSSSANACSSSAGGSLVASARNPLGRLQDRSLDAEDHMDARGASSSFAPGDRVRRFTRGSRPRRPRPRRDCLTTSASPARLRGFLRFEADARPGACGRDQHRPSMARTQSRRRS